MSERERERERERCLKIVLGTVIHHGGSRLIHVEHNAKRGDIWSVRNLENFSLS
jgi:hypothetical protein